MLLQPSRPPQGLSGHHSHPPSQPGHRRGVWEGDGWDSGHPSRLRCGQHPGGQQGQLPAPLETMAEEPWVELPVRWAEGHSWSRDRMPRPEAGVRGRWGADGLGSQDRPRGRTCGCSCPNARRTRSGKRAMPPGPGARFSGKEVPADGFSYGPSPNPTGPRAPPPRASEGRFCARQDVSPGTLSAWDGPPDTRGCPPAGLETNAVGKVVTTHRRGRRHAVGRPHRPPPSIAVRSRGQGLGARGQEETPNAQA